MSKHALRVTLFVLVLFSGTHIFASDYNEYASLIRQEVWSWELPDFNNREIPEEYKNESAVVLACHERVLASRKSKLKLDAFSLFSLRKELLGVQATRRMIAINDKAALQEYSEFDFKEEIKVGNMYIRDKKQTVLGARVIKPDGTIIEVDVNEAVTLTSGKKEKDEEKKIAIPNLEIGDILDYFIHENYQLESMNMPPLLFPFSWKYPIVSYSVHCEIADNLTTEYRSLNGAPTFKQVKDENDNIVLTVEQTHIPKTEFSVWNSFWRQVPMLYLSILNNGSNMVYHPSSARGKGVYPNLDVREIQKDAFYLLNDVYVNSRAYYQPYTTDVRKTVKKYRAKHGELSQEELADLIYNALWFHWPTNSYYYTPTQFMSAMIYLLKEENIDFMIGAVTSTDSPRMSDITNYRDLNYAIVLGKEKRIYTYPSGFGFGGGFDPDIAGEAGVLASGQRLSDSRKGPYLDYTFPQNSAEQNYVKTEMTVRMNDDDPLLLAVHRQMDFSTNMSTFHRNHLTLYEDWDRLMRERLGIEKSLEEEYSSGGRRKYLDDLKTSLQKAREEYKESFKTEISNFHQGDPKDIQDYKVTHFSLFHGDPDFQYQVSYTVEDYVKKAGNNYILSAGKFIPDQMKIEEKDRTRTLDIYMAKPRTYTYFIKFDIPQGYTPDEENVQSLNMNVVNECGSFISKAVINNTGEPTIEMSVTKSFNNSFEPVANWNKLLDILDAATNFETKVVILKR